MKPCRRAITIVFLNCTKSVCLVEHQLFWSISVIFAHLYVIHTHMRVTLVFALMVCFAHPTTYRDTLFCLCLVGVRVYLAFTDGPIDGWLCHGLVSLAGEEKGAPKNHSGVRSHPVLLGLCALNASRHLLVVVLQP